VLDRFFARHDGAVRIYINDAGATPGSVMLRLEQAGVGDRSMSQAIAPPAFVNRHSFIELDARARAQSLMDPGSWRELVGPFDRIESPWLPLQQIAPQSDDGCVVLKGAIAGTPTVVDRVGGRLPGRQHRRSIRRQDVDGSRSGNRGLSERQEDRRGTAAGNGWESVCRRRI